MRKKIVTQWVPAEMDEIMVMADVDQNGQWMVTWIVAKEKASSEVMIIEIIDEQ